MKPMSKAWLDAEAFFAQPPAFPKPETEEPVVVHRDDGAPTSHQRVSTDAIAPTGAQPRTPKVFRLPTSGEGADAHRVAETAPASPGASHADGSTPARARRRHEQKHGEVTIVRPAPAPADVAAQPSPDSLPTGAEGQAQGLPPSAPRLAQLQAQLKALELEIERERALKTQAAIDWIRQAMVDHGITAADLRSS